jgi:flagella basal body P-ring formation protein FlgA
MMTQFFALLFIANLSHAAVLLRVRPHVVVTPNSQVKLAQLIDAQNISAQGAKQLNEAVISVAPQDGGRQEIAQAELTSRLRQIVESEKALTHGHVQVVIPKVVVIDTLKREISEEQVLNELMQAWQPMCADCKLEVEALSIPKINNIRDWSLRLKPELPKGSFSIPVSIVRENGSMTPAWVSGRLLLKKKVPVASRVIEAQERVQKDDFTWEYRDTSYAVDGIPTAEDMIGKRVRQGLRAGDVLWSSLLEKEKAIRRGELVTVKSSEKNWEVSINVIAQQDAFVGDIINLKYPKTNTALVGRVTGQGEVELR